LVFHLLSAQGFFISSDNRFLPASVTLLIETVEAMPNIRELANRLPYNAVLEAMADFRSVHYGWAQEYIEPPWQSAMAKAY
jgi:hypothetical protein